MSDRTEQVLALMRGEGSGPRAAAARAGLRALSGLYAFGIGVYWLMYRSRLLRRVRLKPVVISVGNLTVGGTGKTTTIQFLARALTSEGLKVAILSYGYRAASKDSVGIVSDESGVLMEAGEAGDEAVLLARSLPGVPVLIGRRRVLSGAIAQERFQPDVLLCDDAFQYWRLERDIDLLLVDAVEPWGYGHVLPRGLLREPKRMARRADAFLMTHADLVDADHRTALRHELETFGRPVWTARHAPLSLTDLEGRATVALDEIAGLSVLAVSSLGDPASFEATLRNMGAVVTPHRFPDHHCYTNEDVRQMERIARDNRLSIVTTAKDAVKIREMATPDAWRVLQIALALDEDNTFRLWILQTTKLRSGKE